MTDRETSVLLDELAGRVAVGPPPTGQLLRAGRRARRRRTAGAALAVAAGVAVVTGGVFAVVDPGDGATPAPTVVAEEPPPGGSGQGDEPAGAALAPLPDDPTAGRTGPLADGAAASCAVAYSPDAVRERDFSFDGVVTGIGPSVTDWSGSPGPELVGVTFAVNEWFSGGSGATVTVDLPVPASPGASTTSEGGPVYGVGSRLLVSGADRWDGEPLEPIGWTCGFTRYFDEETAASWR
ncbi:hypothetical protein ABC795_00790 [Blastococcus sp. HT6-30]|uniref:hypothetical protein n=1 Tax=Blastococcus sp. HT6-30 TaxID=3144843 RepID=UPI00321BC9CB